MIKDNILFDKEEVTSSNRCLHTPGSFAKQNLLYVQEVGRLKSLSPHRCIREGLDSYLFLLVLSGSGTLVVDGKEISVRSGDGALIDCSRHYEHISSEEDAWELAWVHFNGVPARGYYELYRKYSNIVFSTGDTAGYNAIIEQLLLEQKNKNLISELKSGEEILTLLNKLMEEVIGNKETNTATERQLNSEIREFLNENYADRDVLEALETSMNSNIEELNACFEKHIGISIEQYVSNRRLNAAKELLRFTVKPMEEVATETGIGDAIIFKQLFTITEGISPEEYRKVWAHWVRG